MACQLSLFDQAEPESFRVVGLAPFWGPFFPCGRTERCPFRCQCWYYSFDARAWESDFVGPLLPVCVECGHEHVLGPCERVWL